MEPLPSITGASKLPPINASKFPPISGSTGTSNDNTTSVGIGTSENLNSTAKKFTLRVDTGVNRNNDGHQQATTTAVHKNSENSTTTSSNSSKQTDLTCNGEAKVATTTERSDEPGAAPPSPSKRRGSLRGSEDSTRRDRRKRGSLVPQAGEDALDASPRKKLLTQKSDVNLLVDAFHGKVRKQSFVSAKGSLHPADTDGEDDFSDLKDLEDAPPTRKQSIECGPMQRKHSRQYSPVPRKRASLTKAPETDFSLSPAEDSILEQAKVLKGAAIWCIIFPIVTLVVLWENTIKTSDQHCTDDVWIIYTAVVLGISFLSGLYMAYKGKTARKNIYARRSSKVVPNDFSKTQGNNNSTDSEKSLSYGALVALLSFEVLFNIWLVKECDHNGAGMISFLGNMKVIVAIWPLPVLLALLPTKWKFRGAVLHVVIFFLCDVLYVVISGPIRLERVAESGILSAVLLVIATGLFTIIGALAAYENEIRIVMERFNRVNEHRLLLKENLDAKKEIVKKLLPRHIEATLSLKVANQMDSIVGICDTYQDVTILFCDLVGFTTWSAELDEDDLVVLLSDLFSVFDMLTEKYGLEKIKTIGDCYMAAGGIPVEHRDHAEKVVSMAKDMMEAVAEFTRPGTDIGLQARIGVHSGPLIAAVIGIKKLSYDVFGDTVNMASRMESSGVPGRVQLSSQTYQKVCHKFNCTKREGVTIKGKGVVDTYLLNGTHEEVAENFDGELNSPFNSNPARKKLFKTTSFLGDNYSTGNIQAGLVTSSWREAPLATSHSETGMYNSWNGTETNYSDKVLSGKAA